MKNTTGYYKNIIFLFVLFAFIRQPVISQSLIVDGIDLMEGFTFGAAAEDINTTGYNVWTVTNTDDQVFDVVPGSLRWAVEQVNKDDYKEQNNYIHFDIPGDGPHIIALEAELPEIKGNVIIDGEVLKGNEPDIIIECKKLTSSLSSKGQVVYLNNWDTNSYFHLQGIEIRNSDSPIYINRAETIKIFSNIIFHEKDVEIEGGDKKHISSQLGNKNVLDLKMQGNFIGSDLNIDTNYTIFNRGFFIYQSQTDRTYDYKIGGANLNERNVFVNCNKGLDISTFPFVSAQNNFFYNIKDGYLGYKTTTKLSENLFYQCTDAIKYNSSYTNPDAYSPLIDTIFFSGNELYSKGTSQNNRPGETIEVFLSSRESDQDAIKYLGSVVSDANGEWELSSGSSGWADPSFIPQTGDIILATSTYDGQTSDFSDTAMIPCNTTNLVITDPATACATDLTDPAIIEGSTGGESILIDQTGFVTEDHTNTGDVYTDMSWWNDQDHPLAMTDNDETTYWHAQPRTSKTNFFIINMQQVYDISKIEVMIGNDAFTDGECEVYIADWRDQTGGYKIEDLNWTKVTGFGPPDPNTTQNIEFNGEIGQFIKFQLTTTVDKDYFDIKEIRVYRHEFSYYEDVDALVPLDGPGHITTSGTYYIKLGKGSCADVQPVNVVIDPNTCLDLNDLLDKSTFNTDNTMGDMDWWDDADGPEAMIDNDPNTWFHARARSYNTNYFIIDMQSQYSISGIVITSGLHVFDEGTCTVYLSEDNENWVKANEFGPIYNNSIETIGINENHPSRYIKFEISTGIDKDYWDIYDIKFYGESALALQPKISPVPGQCTGSIFTLSADIQYNLTGHSAPPYEYTWSASTGTGLSCTDCESPEATITENTTYYVTITDADGLTGIDSLEVTVHPVTTPTIESDQSVLHYIPCQDGYTNDPATLTLTETYGQYAWYQNIYHVNLDSGLVAYYPFNGNAVDETGNGYDGTVNGAVLASDRFGNTNSAYNFDGQDDCIDIGDHDAFETNEFSISLWCKRDGNSSTKSATLFSKYQSYFNNRDFSLDWYNSDFPRERYRDKLGFFTLWTNNSPIRKLDSAFSDPITHDEWVHVTAIKSKNTISLYINGEKVSENMSTGILQKGGSKVYIAAVHKSNTIPDHHFNGLVDDVRFYNRPLNKREVEALYTRGGWNGNNVHLQDGLAAYYPFNGNANDESGNGNDGELRNNPSLTTDRFGNVNSAYEFDGVDDYIHIPHSESIDVTEKITISAWVILDQSNDYNMIISKRSGHTTQYQISVRGIIGHRGDLNFFTGENHVVSYDFPTQQWVHVLATADDIANETKFYVNGELVGVNTDDIELKSTDKFLRIGENSWNNGYWEGKIDDVRIYNRILNDEEIQALYGQASTNPKDIISDDPSLQVSEPGTYYVDVIDANGCSGTTDITINEQKQPGYEHVFAVTNTKDEGEGSFRAAIEGINNSTTSGAEIIFCIPGQAPHTIDVYEQLPAITKPVIIDGATQPANGYTGDSPHVNIRGIICNSVLEVTGGSGTIIQNMKFESDDKGIVLSSNNTRIENCTIHAHAPLIINGDGNTVKNSGIRVKEEVPNSTAITISGSNNTIGGQGIGNTIHNLNSGSYGIKINSTGQENILSENEYDLHKIYGLPSSVHLLSGDANNNVQAPEITYLNFLDGTIEINGTSAYSGDVIEIYTITNDGDATKYHYITSALCSDNIWHASISDFSFTDQHFVVTSTFNNNTSALSIPKLPTTGTSSLIFYSIKDGNWTDNIWAHDRYATVPIGTYPQNQDHIVFIIDHNVTGNINVQVKTLTIETDHNEVDLNVLPGIKVNTVREFIFRKKKQ